MNEETSRNMFKILLSCYFGHIDRIDALEDKNNGLENKYNKLERSLKSIKQEIYSLYHEEKT